VARLSFYHGEKVVSVEIKGVCEYMYLCLNALMRLSFCNDEKGVSIQTQEKLTLKICLNVPAHTHTQNINKSSPTLHVNA
jgi:hypothetical protein